MHKTPMTRTEEIKVQLWKVGDTVVSKDTEFDLTKDKTYTILRRGRFYDCFVIVDDTGKEEEYSQDYFDLLSE